jgi:hypothetical protein
VLDPFLGLSCGLNGGEHFLSASVVKATILAALLRKVQAQHEDVAVPIHHDLNPGVPAAVPRRSIPGPSRTVPDEPVPPGT